MKKNHSDLMNALKNKQYVNKSSQKKSFSATGKTPRPAFLTGLYPLLFILLYDDSVSIIIPFSLRQQTSFGQNQSKQWWPKAPEGHSNFLHKS
jgi:hypothetical protein